MRAVSIGTTSSVICTSEAILGDLYIIRLLVWSVKSLQCVISVIAGIVHVVYRPYLFANEVKGCLIISLYRYPVRDLVYICRHLIDSSVGVYGKFAVKPMRYIHIVYRVLTVMGSKDTH